MPISSQKTNNSLDSSAFHAHASNIPHLFTWIDELIGITENNLSITTFPQTVQLVESVHRYDICFRELLRQTNIFSDNLTRLYAKVWVGVLNLLEYMVKLYHRHVNQTHKLQQDAQKLVDERRSELISSKFKQEESELEQTSLRAKVRNLEAELEATITSKSALEIENSQLREIIREYIKGEEFHIEEAGKFRRKKSIKQKSTKTTDNRKSSRSGKSDRSAVSNHSSVVTVDHINEDEDDTDRNHDPSTKQLRELTKIDLEMNELMVDIVSEEDRQRVLIADLEALLKNHPDVFGANSSQRGIRKGEKSQDVLRVDVYVQVDEKDQYYALEDLADESKASFSENNSSASSVNYGNSSPGNEGMFRRQDSNRFGYPSTTAQTSHPNTGPSNNNNNTSNALNNNNNNSNRNNNNSSGPRFPVVRLPSSVSNSSRAANPLAGLDIPYQIRRHMSKFPMIYRLPPMEWLSQTILSIYLDKVFNDEHLASLKIKKLALPDYIYNYFLKVYGNHSITDIQMIQLIRSCEQHLNHKRVSLFARQLGLLDKEASPELDIRDTDFVLTVIKSLSAEGLFHQTEDTVIDRNSVHSLESSRKSLNLIGKSATTLLSCHEMPRALALPNLQNILGKWLFGGTDDLVRKINNILSSSKGSKFILIDDFMNIAMEQWLAVRAHWTEHLRFLFKYHTLVYRVVSEAQFASDSGAVDRDTILMQVKKDTVEDCPRRLSRLFMRLDRHDSLVDELDSRRSHGITGLAVSSLNADELSVSTFDGSNSITTAPGISSVVSGMAFSGVINDPDENIIQSPRRKTSIVVTSVPSTISSGLNVSSVDSQGRPQQTSTVITSGTIPGQSVVELMNKRGFVAAMKDLLPRMAPTQMEDLFEAACDYSTMLSDRALERLWTVLHYSDGTKGFRNNRTGSIQKTLPFRPTTFRCLDVFEDAFIFIVLKNDLLAKSPLMDHLHIAPRDIWPNADMFHRQRQHTHGK